MKLFAILSAGAMLAASLVPATAVSAQGHGRDRVEHRTVVHHNERGRHHVRSRTVCRNVWRHGHRQRVCRQVRR